MQYVCMALTCALVLACVTPAMAADAKTAREALLQAKKELRSGSGSRLGSQLLALQKSRGAKGDPVRKLPMRITRDGTVSVSGYGDDPAALRTQLAGRGMRDARVIGNAVTGRVAIGLLGEVAKASGLRFLKPAMAITHRGLATSQGDVSIRTDEVRSRFGVNGKDVRVGFLSDSYDCAIGPFLEGFNFTTAAEDIANDDLPRDVLVLKDLSEERSLDCSDEGRAMMQIVHDVAPKASQAFYTAFESEADFANGIRELAKAGATVIVDDVIYFAEPMFEDGIIADAVNDVYKQGVAYFSSAGNEGRQSYQSRYRASGQPGIFGPTTERHDFDPGPGVDTLQEVFVSDTGAWLISFQWDQPAFSANGKRGSQSDVDALFYDENGDLVFPCELVPDDAEVFVCQFAGATDNIDGDPVEVAVLLNFGGSDAVFQLGLEYFSGPKPALIKYVWNDIDAGIGFPIEFDTASSTTYGHANAFGAEAIGAAAWYRTAQWGTPEPLLQPACIPACMNVLSSAGGTPILFDRNGRRLSFPRVLLKPGVTGPDAGNTSFFFFPLTFDVPNEDLEPDIYPNFGGTSASAPHIAALAALMLDQRRRDIASGRRFLGPRELSPDYLRWILRLTARDIRRRSVTLFPPVTDPIANGGGFDFDSGFGLVDGVRAMSAIKGF